jgi:excisionase family DNA binding protein
VAVERIASVSKGAGTISPPPKVARAWWRTRRPFFPPSYDRVFAVEKGLSMSTLWTVDDCADYVKVSRATIWRLVRTQGLPAVRPHSELRFIPEEVTAWLGTRQVS